MKNLSRVVLVGRTNVGKSTIFNRLSSQAKSITFDRAGITRDFVTDQVTWRNRVFELVDTGGISFAKTTDEIGQQVRAKALAMIDESEVILMVIDASAPLIPEDFEIASYIRKKGKHIIVVGNKIDAKGSQVHLHDADQFGFKTRVDISATHGKGIGDLLEAVCNALPENPTTETKDPTFKLVLLGKPNVGKSTLMNALLQEERAIVTPIAGTTREPISERITFYQEDILLTDTPGVRRKRSIDEPLETMMVRTSFSALDRADIVLFLIDASEGDISDQEWKLLFYAFEQHKALIVLFNKDDLATSETKEELKFSNELYHYFLKKLPQLNISCKTGKNIGKILPLVQKVWQNHSQKLVAEDLFILFKSALQDRPLYHKTQPLKIHNVKQVGTAPMTLLLIVNEPAWFGDAQCGFFEQVLRNAYDLKGAPIKFILRKGG